MYMVKGSATPSIEITGQNGFPTKGCLPSFLTGKGTYTTSGKFVIGSSANFSNDLIDNGTWLYSSALNEVRKVDRVVSNNLAVLTAPFSTDVTVAETVKTTKPLYKAISGEGQGTGSIINGKIIGTDIQNWANEFLLNPITYDGTTDAIKFQFLK